MRNPLSTIQSTDGILSAFNTNHIGSIALSSQPFISDHTRAAVINTAQTIVLYSQHQKRIINNILTLSRLGLNLILISLTQFN